MRSWSVSMVLVGLVACGGGEDPVSNEAAPDVAPTPEQSAPPVPVSQPFDASDAFVALPALSTGMSSDSVQIGESGLFALADMGSMMCGLETEDGNLAEEYASDGSEEVIDVGDLQPIGEAFMVQDRGGLRFESVAGDASVSWAIEGLVEARFDGDRVVVVYGEGSDCHVGWFDHDGAEQYHVDYSASYCGSSLDVGADGTVWIGGPDGVLRVDQSGSSVFVDTAHARVADVDGVLIVAQRGGLVSGFDRETATQLWSVTMGGSVFAIEPDRVHGGVFIAADAFDRVVRLHRASDGATLGSIGVSQAVNDVALNRAGTHLAVSTEGQTAFFRVQ